MEGFKIPEHGGGRRNSTVSNLSPPSAVFPSFLTRESLCLNTVKDFAEAFVLFEHLEIIYRVASYEVEQYQGEHCLFISPSLFFDVHVSTDILPQAQYRGEIKIDTGRPARAVMPDCVFSSSYL
jgi:hypothetical protein